MSDEDDALPLPVKVMNLFVFLLLVVIFHSFYLFFVRVAFGSMPMPEFMDYLLEHNLVSTVIGWLQSFGTGGN